MRIRIQEMMKRLQTYTVEDSAVILATLQQLEILCAHQTVYASLRQSCKSLSLELKRYQTLCEQLQNHQQEMVLVKTLSQRVEQSFACVDWSFIYTMLKRERPDDLEENSLEWATIEAALVRQAEKEVPTLHRLQAQESQRHLQALLKQRQELKDALAERELSLRPDATNLPILLRQEARLLEQYKTNQQHLKELREKASALLRYERLRTRYAQIQTQRTDIEQTMLAKEKIMQGLVPDNQTRANILMDFDALQPKDKATLEPAIRRKFMGSALVSGLGEWVSSCGLDLFSLSQKIHDRRGKEAKMKLILHCFDRAHMKQQWITLGTSHERIRRLLDEYEDVPTLSGLHENALVKEGGMHLNLKSDVGIPALLQRLTVNSQQFATLIECHEARLSLLQDFSATIEAIEAINDEASLDNEKPLFLTPVQQEASVPYLMNAEALKAQLVRSKEQLRLVRKCIASKEELTDIATRSKHRLSPLAQERIVAEKHLCQQNIMRVQQHIMDRFAETEEMIEAQEEILMESSGTAVSETGALEHRNIEDKWLSELRLLAQTLPLQSQQWVLSLLASLDTSMTRVPMQLQIDQLLYDLKAGLKFYGRTGNLDLIAKYQLLCPQPSEDMSILIKMKPTVATDISLQKNSPITASEWPSLVALFEQLQSHFKDASERKRFLLTRLRGNIEVMVRRLEQGVAIALPESYRNGFDDPLYDELRQVGGFQTLCRAVLRLFYSLFNACVHHQYDPRNNFFYVATPVERTLQKLSASLPNDQALVI